MASISVVTSAERLAELAPEWRKLFGATTLRTPSKSPLWQLTWWRHFGERRSVFCRHDMRVFVLRDDREELLAIAPMMLTHRPGGTGLFTELQFFGADPYVTQLRGPVCRRERLPEVSARLVEHVRACGDHDFAQWRGMAPALAGEDCEIQPQLEDIDSFLTMAESWDAFHAALPKKTRKHLRKSQNDLRADNVDYKFRVTMSPEAAPASLRRFYELHAVRAALADVVAHPNVFADPTARAFLDDYCAQMARDGDLRLFEILVGGEIVATRLGFALGDELYLYFSGYDPAYGRYSIMTTLMAETLKWSHDQGVRLVNLSSGVDRSKTRFRPQTVTTEGYYTQRPGWRGDLALTLMRRLRYGGAPAPVAPQPDADDCVEA
jgi:CelD/BcsL family acetyltransferase involved in cellulose biosynthesis